MHENSYTNSEGSRVEFMEVSSRGWLDASRAGACTGRGGGGSPSRSGWWIASREAWLGRPRNWDEVLEAPGESYSPVEHRRKNRKDRSTLLRGEVRVLSPFSLFSHSICPPPSLSPSLSSSRFYSRSLLPAASCSVCSLAACVCTSTEKAVLQLHRLRHISFSFDSFSLSPLCIFVSHGAYASVFLYRVRTDEVLSHLLQAASRLLNEKFMAFWREYNSQINSNSFRMRATTGFILKSWNFPSLCACEGHSSTKAQAYKFINFEQCKQEKLENSFFFFFFFLIKTEF